MEKTNKSRFNKSAPIKEGYSALKFNTEGCVSSHVVETTSSRRGKKHYGKCLAGTAGFLC